VLKYDEVMNEQRKVIYKRRDQILEEADLRDQTLLLLAEAVDGLISTYCAGEFGDDWDAEGLHTELEAYWPSETTVEELSACTSTDELYELLMEEATAYFEQREEQFGPDTMRQIERQVMLRLVDQHWRDHLHEMDYLEEGIHLRAMGQKDPLVEWQREGFEMFGTMIENVNRDFVKYIMHVQVVVEDKPASQPEKLNYSAPEDPSSAGNTMAAAARAEASAQGAEAPPETVEEPVNTPVVKSEWEKTPRNAPCPCGSGKKFKLCHGAA
jgi:preprotein translocase subunit SecA